MLATIFARLAIADPMMKVAQIRTGVPMPRTRAAFDSECPLRLGDRVLAMQEKVTRRDRKKAKTQHDLVEAARQLIVEGGVGDLRVADITDRVDVSLGTFYTHFATKDDIVEAVVASVLGPLANAVGDYGDTAADPAVATAIGVRELVGVCDVDPELAHLLVRLEDAERRFERMIWDRAAPIITRAIGTGRFRCAGEDPDAVVRAAIAAVFALIRSRVEHEGPFDPRTASVLVLQMLGIDHSEAVEISQLDLPRIAPPSERPVPQWESMSSENRTLWD